MVGRLIGVFLSLLWLALLYSLACALGRVFDGFIMGAVGMAFTIAFGYFLRELKDE